MTDKILILSITIFLHVLVIALIATAIIISSYGILFSLSYIFEQYPNLASSLSTISYSIEISHILLTSIFLSICLISAININISYEGMINHWFKYITSDLSNIVERLEKIEANTQEINEISENTSTLKDSINYELPEIKRELIDVAFNTKDIKQ